MCGSMDAGVAHGVVAERVRVLVERLRQQVPEADAEPVAEMTQPMPRAVLPAEERDTGSKVTRAARECTDGAGV